MKIIIYCIFCFYLISLTSLLYLPKNKSLQIGKFSSVTILSPNHFEIETSVDKKLSDEKLKQKIDSVSEIYRRDFSVESNSEKQLIHIFTYINKLKESSISTENMVMIKKGLVGDVSIGINVLDMLLENDKKDLKFIQLLSQQYLKNIYAEGIHSQEELIKKLNAKFDGSKLTKKYRLIIGAIIEKVAVPNLIYDGVSTEKKIQDIKKNFVRYMTIIKKGQPIIYKGDEISSLNLEILEKIGLYRAAINWKAMLPLIAGIIGVVFLLERMLSMQFSLSNRRLILIFSLESIFITSIYFLSLKEQLAYGIAPYYLIPIPIFSILFSLLINKELAMTMACFSVILMTFLFGFNPKGILFVLLNNAIIVYAISSLKTRRDYVMLGPIVGIISVLFVFIIEMVNPGSLKSISIFLVEVFLCNVVSAIIALGVLPYIEDMFAITTKLKLLDYADINHHLMKRMLNESSGTYYHSLLVANLAEAASEAVNANGILARVGSYYHDIGKLNKPEYFVENQLEIDNPHDNAMPSLSALTILSHPKDGLDLAKKYNLPKEIQDIIIEHHGTSLLVYFYYKMIRLTTNDIVDENQFRYDCPKPSSRESAIIMLADSVEAAVRALKDPNIKKIATLIDNIINDKIEDNQLSQSNLTFANIETIKAIFSKVMTSQHHSRIQYPDKAIKADE